MSCSPTRGPSPWAKRGSTASIGSRSLAEQRALLDDQLALAEELGLPVVIHSREAETETAAALEPFRGTVVLHCFSSPRLLETALERGYFVSFAGNVTYPKADDLRAAAARVPADRILAETDAPYLAPQPVRGRRNEPAHVVHTLADARAPRVTRARPRSHGTSTPTLARHSPCREPGDAQEGPRPALPQRPEHPRA